MGAKLPSAECLLSSKETFAATKIPGPSGATCLTGTSPTSVATRFRPELVEKFGVKIPILRSDGLLDIIALDHLDEAKVRFVFFEMLIHCPLMQIHHESH